ncbi:MAG: hypothetical protein EA381_03995 [Planctomycetaceae bacterium]|nr:MAG: hypothetical protein EA381_03995 [Planctomycetaceae bacterium]
MALIEFKSATSSSETSESGNLLADLERRQNDVLQQLDELDLKLCEILKGLGVTPVESEGTSAGQTLTDSEDGEDGLDAPQPSRISATVSRDTDDASVSAGGFSKLPATQLAELTAPAPAIGRQPASRAA